MTKREVAAFCIAPLAAPCSFDFVVRMMLRGEPGMGLAASAFSFSLMIPLSYSAALLGGLPLYRYLVARRLDSWLMLSFAGLAIGSLLGMVVTWILLGHLNLPMGVLGGSLGLQVGAIFALIRGIRPLRSYEGRSALK